MKNMFELHVVQIMPDDIPLSHPNEPFQASPSRLTVMFASMITVSRGVPKY